MRILFDIVHPAGVHVFKNTIWELQKKGHETIVTLRDKDNAELLLKKYGIKYIRTNIKTGKTLFSSFIELLKRMYILFNIIRKTKPDILVGKTNVNIAPLGFLFNIPVIEFNDTDVAFQKHFISYPFDTAIVTPECFNFKYPFWKKKHITYPGYHELAYLNKKRFTPDKNIINQLNTDKKKKIVIIRLVSLKAHHDTFLKGISTAQLNMIIDKLNNIANIFISSEYELPDEYKKFKVPVSVEKFLDFLSICDLYIGESATVASEACMLGIPAIYVSDSPRCYTNELKKKYGVCKNFSVKEIDKAIDWATKILTNDIFKPFDFTFDLTELQLKLIEKYARI